jgi:predicted cobalt transporter CbtA
MKKNVLKIMIILSLIIAPSIQMMAQTANLVELNSTYLDPSGAHNHPHKSPVEVPSIILEEHSLQFYTPCYGYELRIVDDNSNVVYSLLIPSGSTQVILPNTLIGEYELQLITGNLMFYGTIVL